MQIGERRLGRPRYLRTVFDFNHQKAVNVVSVDLLKPGGKNESAHYAQFN